MTDIKAMEDRIDEAADAQATASAQKAFLAAQMKASDISVQIARMIQDQHPGTHPAIVTMALTNALASLVALASQGNVIKAVSALHNLHNQTRATALRLMEIRKQGAAGSAPAN